MWLWVALVVAGMLVLRFVWTFTRGLILTRQGWDVDPDHPNRIIHPDGRSRSR